MSERRLTYSFGPLERRGLLGPVRAGQAAVIASGGVAGDRRPRRVAVGAGRARRRRRCSAAALATACLPARRPHGGGVAAADARVLVAPAPAAGRFASDVTAAPGHAWGAAGCCGRAPAAGRAAAAARRPARGRRLSRPTARSGVRTLGPAADVGAGLPGRRVLAARPGGPGAPPGPLGARALRGRRQPHPARAVDRAHRARPGRRAGALGARRARSGGPAARHADDRLLPGAHLVRPLAWPRSTRSCWRSRSTPSACAIAAPTASTRALVEQTERVAQGLEAAEVTVLGALSPGQLARALRTAFDPYARSELTAAGGLRPGPRRPGRGQRLAPGRARDLGALPDRRRAARHVLDRRVAAGRGLADVHGLAARPLGRRAHRLGDVRAAGRATAPRARSRRRSPAIAPTGSCARASGSPRRRASARRPTPPGGARPSSPPATARSASAAS